MNKTKRHEREVHMASLSPIMEEVLARGGSVELTVTGNSMKPMLLHKISRVRLAPVRELRVGDLPLYRRDNGHFVLHRIVAAENGVFTCCGDNQWRLEKGLRRDQMLAVVTDFNRSGSWIACENRVYGMYWRYWLCIRPLREFVSRGVGWLKRRLFKRHT